MKELKASLWKTEIGKAVCSHFGIDGEEKREKYDFRSLFSVSK
jgi:hypothetical protein